MKKKDNKWEILGLLTIGMIMGLYVDSTSFIGALMIALGVVIWYSLWG